MGIAVATVPVMSATAATTARSAFRVPAQLDLAAIDPRGRPVGPRDKDAAAEAMVELADRLDELQEACLLYTSPSPRDRS